MKEMVLGLIRHTLTIAGGSLVTHGLAEPGEAAELVGAIVTIIGVAWSMWAKHSAKSKAKAADSVAGRIVPLLVFGVLSLAALGSFSGCSTSLEQGGVYRGDKVTFQADRTITSSYEVLHAFVKWEYDQREALARWPEIRQAADVVRRNAEHWIATAMALREAYSIDPTSDNRAALERSLATLSAAISEVARYLSQPPAP